MILVDQPLPRPTSPPRGIFFTDLDGTLLRSDGGFNAADLEALTAAGAAGTVRVIATGRSLYSLRRSGIEPTGALPVDFLIFASGGGLLRWGSTSSLRAAGLAAAEVAAIARRLVDLRLDFMVQAPLPHEHRLAWHRGGAGANEDFDRRLALYREHAGELGPPEALGEASELLVIAPTDRGPQLHRDLRAELAGFSVIRTTSPLDRRSLWIEIFAPEVSKGRMASHLASSLGLRAVSAAAVGNDYNDLDLLLWAGSGFVTGNAPAELRARFATVAGNDAAGVAEALRRWGGASAAAPPGKPFGV